MTSYLPSNVLPDGLFPNGIVLAQEGGLPIGQIVILAVIGAMFFFFIIRPQQQRQKEQAKLLSDLSIGDEIITIGGFHGEIVALGEETVELEIDEDVIITLAKKAVSRTLKAAPVDPAAAAATDSGFDDGSFDDSVFDDAGDQQHADTDNDEFDDAAEFDTHDEADANRRGNTAAEDDRA